MSISVFKINSEIQSIGDPAKLFVKVRFASLAVREMDANLDRLVPWIGWKIGYSIILYAAIVTYSNAQTLKRQIMRIPHSRAFSLLWAGFIIAVPFAQLVGHGAFLQTVMGDDYSRNYPRIIEELGEFMGYVLLLIGGFELILQLRAARPGDYRPPSFDS